MARHSRRLVQLSVVVLKAATAWAFETGMAGRDPLAGFRRPRATAGKGAGEAWNADEAKTFLVSVADDRLVAAWTLLLTRGLRRGELAGPPLGCRRPRWRDSAGCSDPRLVDGKPVDSVPKTYTGRRTIPLGASTGRKSQVAQDAAGSGAVGRSRGVERRGVCLH